MLQCVDQYLRSESLSSESVVFSKQSDGLAQLAKHHSYLLIVGRNRELSSFPFEKVRQLNLLLARNRVAIQLRELYASTIFQFHY
jgi:hypothetical protein